MVVGKCPVCGKDEIIGQRTHGEAMREMSDEELVYYLCRHDFCVRPILVDDDAFACDGDCETCIAEWLKETDA